MIKSSSLLLGFLCLLTAWILVIGTGFHDRLVPGFSAQAKHWATVDYYREHQGGYEASAARRTREVFE